MADLVITATQVQAGTGQIITKTAGATITAGQSVYLDSNDQVQLCDADNSATTATCAGIAVGGASSGQKVAYQTDGTITIGAAASVVAGEIYLTSDTPGGIRPVADVDATDYVSIIGVGNGSNGIAMKIFNSGIQHA